MLKFSGRYCHSLDNDALVESKSGGAFSTGLVASVATTRVAVLGTLLAAGLASLAVAGDFAGDRCWRSLVVATQ